MPILDLRPLRASRSFRLLAGIDAGLGLGGEITVVAVPLQVYAVTGSTLAVGLIGLVQLLATTLLGPAGGVVTDMVERRTVILAGLAVMASAPLLLALASAHGDPPLAALYALAGVRSASEAVVTPARRSALPFLLRGDLLVAAQPIEFLISGVSGVAGPLAAGALIASRGGFASAYVVDAAAFLLVLPAALRLPRLGIAAHPPPHGAGVSALREGIEFVLRSPGVRGVFIVDSCAMLFGNPVALFPALGAELGAGPRGTALLYAALPAGVVVATLTSGWTSGVRRDGRVICLAAGAWGAGVIGAGLAPWLWLAVVCIAAAGAGDTISGVFRSAIVQREPPAPLRGRVSGLEWAQVNAGPALGDVEGGAVGALAGPRVSIVSGGVACALGVALVALLARSFWSHERAPGDAFADAQPPDSGAPLS